MQLITNKSLDELNARAIQRLSQAGINTSPGSIAKLFYNLFNEDISELYKTLNIYHIKHFLSTAENEYVDFAGSLLNCYRLDGESDNDYKYRISKQSLTLERANETAIRLAILTIDGVQDVVMRNYSHGPGTFSIIIIKEPNAANSDVIPYLVRHAVEEVDAYGMKFYIYEPIEKSIKLRIKLQTETITTSDFIDLSNRITNVLKTYLNSRKIGEEFNAQEVTSLILSLDKRIKKFSVLSFTIKGKESNFKNAPCRWNERYVLSSEPDALTIM